MLEMKREPQISDDHPLIIMSCGRGVSVTVLGRVTAVKHLIHKYYCECDQKSYTNIAANMTKTHKSKEVWQIYRPML